MKCNTSNNEVDASIALFTKASLGENADIEKVVERLLEMKESAKVLVCEKILCDGDVITLDHLLRKHYLSLHLTSIRLPSNGLTAASAPALCRILQASQTLRELDLRNNPLGNEGLKLVVETLIFQESSVPGAGATLTSLNVVDNELTGGSPVAEIARLLRLNSTMEELYLGQNRLACRGMKDLAQALAVNTTLQRLSLPYSNIKASAISSLICGLQQNPNRRLRCLDLEYNLLGVKGAQALENFLLYDKTLEELNISANELGVDGAKAFTSVLTYNFTLRELRLSDNQIGNEGAEAIALGLAKNSSLQNLHLDGNSLEDAALSSLATTLKSNSTLLSLNLSNNRIACEGIMDLARALAFNMTLENLDLQGNRMRDDGAMSLADAIGHDKSSLKSVSWDDNLLSEQGEAALGHAFSFRGNRIWLQRFTTPVSRGKKVNQLDLSERSIGDAELIVLAETLNAATTRLRIRCLHVTGTNITGRGIQALSSWLSNSDRLVSLDQLFVFKSRAGDDGAHALGYVLETNKDLQVLSVTDSGVTVDGARSLARGLSHNATLTRLTLSRNRIGDAGLVELAHVLQQQRNNDGQEVSMSILRSLHVTRNNISDESMAAISKTILSELVLRDNEITDEGALDLAKGFLTDCRLMTLGLSGNVGITKKGRGALRACLPDGCQLDLH